MGTLIYVLAVGEVSEAIFWSTPHSLKKKKIFDRQGFSAERTSTSVAPVTTACDYGYYTRLPARGNFDDRWCMMGV